MALPTYENLSLQDDTYITESVQARVRATRRLESESIARRPGKKLLNSQLQEKVIEVAGTILADTPTLLQDAVDTLVRTCDTVEGALEVEQGRVYTATAERLMVKDRAYNQSIAEFEIQFVCSKPYAEGNSVQAGFLIPSGTQSLTLSTTISGTFPNRPKFTLIVPSGTLLSSVYKYEIQYSSTANTLTLSGSYAPGDTLVANYDRYLITQNGTQMDYTGQLDDIAIGSATFYITVSGQNDGTRGTLEYSPRYY